MSVNLDELVKKSEYIIREAKAQFKNPAMLWSTGKDSTTLLSLVRGAFFGEVPWPVIHIDTGKKFPEIYQFRDRIAMEWNLNLVVARNEEWIDKVGPEKTSRFECCTKLKTEALKQLIAREGYGAILVSIRRDEHGIRGKERYMSPRDKNFRWRVYRERRGDKQSDSGLEALQDVEFSGWGIYVSDFGPEVSHVRVHPLLHWTEEDVWRYVLRENLPVNPLYFSKNGKRYRSLGCMPCTQPFESKASTVEEIYLEVKATRGMERSGRAQDKEEAYAMERLRSLGYM